jgi:hypothetical protein
VVVESSEMGVPLTHVSLVGGLFNQALHG